MSVCFLTEQKLKKIKFLMDKEFKCETIENNGWMNCCWSYGKRKIFRFHTGSNIKCKTVYGYFIWLISVSALFTQKKNCSREEKKKKFYYHLFYYYAECNQMGLGGKKSSFKFYYCLVGVLFFQCFIRYRMKHEWFNSNRTKKNEK